jgi:hypothetical protein
VRQRIKLQTTKLWSAAREKKVILVSTGIYNIILKNTTFIHHITGRAMHEKNGIENEKFRK